MRQTSLTTTRQMKTMRQKKRTITLKGKSPRRTQVRSHRKVRRNLATRAPTGKPGSSIALLLVLGADWIAHAAVRALLTRLLPAWLLRQADP